MTPSWEKTRAQLAAIPGLTIRFHAPLREYTRFGLGGPADLYGEAAGEAPFVAALAVARESGLPFLVIGGGTNLIVADEGFPGIVLRFRGERITSEEGRVVAEAGAGLQDLVDHTIDQGLSGLHTMTGIPGSVGAAIYGNAGAYGNSISGSVESVRFHDGRSVRQFTQAECEFRYRESIFKRRKDWIIFSAVLRLPPGDRDALRARADEIRRIRDAKYPPTMKCAGSIFKNFLLAELPSAVRDALPPKVVIEGKVPSAYFLEQVGAKGMAVGGIRVADYHANLLYNEGTGRATDLRVLIDDLKARVRGRFGIEIEEEVQYVGFPA